MKYFYVQEQNSHYHMQKCVNKFYYLELILIQYVFNIDLHYDAAFKSKRDSA